MAYHVHNFQNGEVIEAAPINEMDAQIAANESSISGKIDISSKGIANGVASLDTNSHVPNNQLNVASTTETQQIITNYSAS